VSKRKLSTPWLAQQRARQSNAAASKAGAKDLQYAIGHEICSIRQKQQTAGDAFHDSGLGLHSEERSGQDWRQQGGRLHNKHESMLTPVQARGSAAYTRYHKRNALMQKHMPTAQVKDDGSQRPG